MALALSVASIKAGMLDEGCFPWEKAAALSAEAATKAIDPWVSVRSFAEVVGSTATQGVNAVAATVNSMPALFIPAASMAAPVLETAATAVPVVADPIVPSAAESSSAIFSGIDTPTVVGVIAVLGIAFTYKHLSDAGYDVKGPSALIYDYLKAGYNRVTGATALAEKAAKAAKFAEADALVTAHETAQWNADIKAAAQIQPTGIVDKLTSFASNHKYGLAGAALACAGLGAYYGYKYYQNASSVSNDKNEVE